MARNRHSDAPHHPAGLPQRQTLAGCQDGATLDRRCHAGGPKGFRRLKARKQLPILRTALAAHQAKNVTNANLEQQASGWNPTFGARV
jgi:hypothetical protein